MKQKILLIEDDNGSRLGIVRSLSQKGYAVNVASNLANAEEDVLARRFDAVILGINLSDGAGSRFIKGVRAYDPALPIVVITGCDAIDIAVDAVRCGADNVLAKPVDYEALCESLRALLHDESLQAPQTPQRRQVKRCEERFFGTGPAAQQLLELAAQVANTGQPVLITGETGTGKGLLAKWMHQNSRRANRPFASVNCSGLRCDLLGAELFGSVTGSARSRPGLIEKAAGGTVFVDEIGDMDLAVQARLLAVLKAGGTQAAPDFRLVSTSNKQLDIMVLAGAFLPELLTAIGAATVRIPPLRERLRELPDLVTHLLDEMHGRHNGISDEAMRTLETYRWPGNLRELKNALEQGLILSHGGRLGPEHFSWLKSTGHGREPHPMLTMSEVKEQHIAAVLQQANGDLNQVANCLGVSRATMYRRRKQLGRKSL